MKTYLKTIRLIGSIFVLLLGLYWVWSTGSQNSSNLNTHAPQVGFLAPEIDLESIDSSQLSSSNFEGKAVILNFWASWCPPCRAEMPDFQQASEEFLNSELLIIGINATNQDTPVNVARFLQENNISFPIALDPEGVAGRDFQVHSLPTTFFIDANGVVQNIVIGGPLPLSFLRIEAERLLEGID
jgi:thiol-disulfide isomerase/thioredoxin